MSEFAFVPPHALLRFFQYEHLPKNLQAISRPFKELAETIDRSSGYDNPEKAMALRKLLEAKDCAVRASMLEN